MVVTLPYTCTGTEIGTKIGIKIERYGDGEKQYIPMPICLGCLEFVACRLVVSVGSFHFGSVGLVWFRFFDLHKKFF